MIPRLKTAVLIVLSSLMIVSANTNASFSFDIDGDGNKDALTDGLLVLRHLFGFSGSTLSEGAVATDATRSEATDLESHLETNAQYLDIDGDGQNDALTDGLLLLRLLFGFEGDTLVQGAVSADATRTTASSIEAYIDSPLTYFAPSISGLPSAISVAENQTAVATVSASDPNLLDPLRKELSRDVERGGDDHGGNDDPWPDEYGHQIYAGTQTEGGGAEQLRRQKQGGEDDADLQDHEQEEQPAVESRW